MFKRFLVPTILTIILLALTNPLWLSFEDHEFSFNLESVDSNKASFNIGFITKEGRPHRDGELVKEENGLYIYKNDRSRIAIVKFYFFEPNQSYKLKDLVLKGTWTLKIDELSDFKTSNVENFRLQDGAFCFETVGELSSIEFHISPRLYEQFNIHFLLLISLAILSFIISAKFTLIISQNFATQNTSYSSFIFLFLFFSLLFIPMLNINTDPNAIAENRFLSQYKNLFNEENEINNSYGSDFEKWFNDRFFLRSELIRAYNDLLVVVFNQYENSKVIAGKDDWLFLKNDFSILIDQNLKLYTETELKTFSSYLSDIDKWAKANGKAFYYVIAPNKSNVYHEYYPSKYTKTVPDSEGRTMQLIKYLEENTDVDVLYLYDAMHANKDKGLLYYKNDTHWNLLGGYYAYDAIMKEFFPSYETIKFTHTSLEKWEIGDLTNMNTNIPPIKTTEYIVPIYAVDAKEVLDLPNIDPNLTTKDRMFINEKPIIDKNIFILHDSFFKAHRQPLTSTFRETYYVWRYEINKSDLSNIQENYDIILLQHVERLSDNIVNLKFPEVQ